MKQNTVLVVVDMQLVAFDGVITAPINDGESVIDAAAKLVKICRAAELDILYLQTCAASGQPYAKDQHGWELHPLLEVRSDERVVFKRNSSGFDGTNLSEVLEEMGARRLIVCGNWTEFCVANTVKDAAKLGFEICIAKDGHGTVAANDKVAREIVREQNESFIDQGFEVLEVEQLQKEFPKLV